MKAGRLALGIAESYRGRNDGTRSTLAGAVVAADRTVDDFAFSSCTVGGEDTTDGIVALWRRLDRPDVRYLFVAGVALAWYNVVRIGRVAEAIGRPVIAVSFEGSDGLESGISDAFNGESRTDRLEAYRSLPDRHCLDSADEPLFFRSAGVDREEAASILDAYLYDRRPEPLRVAKRLATRIDAARRDSVFSPR